MNVAFMDVGIQELYEMGTTNDKRYRKISRNKKLVAGLIRAVKILEQADNIEMVAQFSFLHYEKLKHELSGISSVRLCGGRVERLLFIEEADRITITLIEINQDHYGNV